MRKLIVIVTILLLAGGCAFENDEAMERDGSPGDAKSVTWVARDPQSRLGAGELLAMQLVDTSQEKITSGNMTARLMDNDPPYSVVAVEERQVSKNITVRTMYRLQERAIVEYSYPEYLTGADDDEGKKRRKRYAQEVAIQAKEGRLPLFPVMYESRYMYSPRYDGSCMVEITEKDPMLQVIGTYNIDVCPDQKQ